MRNRALLLATGFAALSLAACQTPVTSTQMAADASKQDVTIAGTYLAANFAAASGDVKDAAGFYANALKDDPANKDLLDRAFLFSAEAGDVDQAVALADRVLAQDPDDRPAHLVRQVGALAKKDYAAVNKDLATPATGAFALLTNQIVQAWALAANHDTDGALKALDVLANQPGVEGLRLLHRALILDYGGRDKEADAAYRLALMGMNTGPRVADAYGRFLLRHGRAAEAKTLYSHAAMENPGNPVTDSLLRDIAEKRVPAPLVATPQEGVAEALFGIAASLNAERNADVAILYINLALYLRPDFDLGRVLLANRYEGLSRYQMANLYYDQISPVSPYYAMTQVQSAINDGRMNHADAGIAKMRALAMKRPQDVDVWTALGDLLRSGDQYAEAAAAYDKAIAATPPGDRALVSLYYARGISLERSGRWDGAEKDFQLALKLNPDRADVLNYLGYSWVDKGVHLDEAVSMLEKARALRPLDGYIADSVGWAYYKLGRYQDATRTLEQAVDLAPGAADVNDHLGDAYWRVGRKADARFQWNHALALGPDSKEKPVIERKLQIGLDAVSASGS